MKKPPVFIALDLNSEGQVLSLVEKTYLYVRGYKIGPRLFLKYGNSLLEKVKSYGDIFLDFKFFDIPSSTEEAVRSAYDTGASYTTVHASVGEETLKRLAILEKELNQTRPFSILCVTVLSSESGPQDVLQKKVESLADLVLSCGLKGLVCSPMEVKKLRAKYPEAFLVTPGIRFETDSYNDQKRVMTPQQAFENGSSLLVVGRSVIHAEDPLAICRKLAESLGFKG